MITLQEASLIGLCLEGFLYGKMFILYALICGKEVQLFLGLLGLYSGIFAIYLQSLSNKSRTAIIFYSLCLLYVLSGATVVCDVLGFIFQVSNSFVKNIFFLINCAPAVPYDISIASSSNWLGARDISPFYDPICSKRLLRLPRPMYHSTHRPMYLIIRFIHLNLPPRSIVVGSCGVEISMSWLFRHFWRLRT